MSRIIDNTLVMSQEETFDETTRLLSENEMPDVDREWLENERKKMLKEQIDNVINEELGIANEVSNLTSIIEKQVYLLINRGIEKKVFNVKTDLSDVNVDYAYKDFNDKNSLITWVTQRGYDGYSYKTNTIYLTIYSFNGNLDIFELNDTIMHECNHYWECKKQGRSPYSRIYGEISRGVTNSNPCVSEMCKILYYCNKFEINSFVNGSYSSSLFKRARYPSYNDFIADNTVNEIYTTLKNAESTIRKYENSFYYIPASLWLTYKGILNCNIDEVGDKVIEIAKKSYEYLLERIGKAYALYVKKMKEIDEKEQERRIKMMLKKGI